MTKGLLKTLAATTLLMGVANQTNASEPDKDKPSEAMALFNEISKDPEAFAKKSQGGKLGNNLFKNAKSRLIFNQELNNFIKKAETTEDFTNLIVHYQQRAITEETPHKYDTQVVQALLQTDSLKAMKALVQAKQHKQIDCNVQRIVPQSPAQLNTLMALGLDLKKSTPKEDYPLNWLLKTENITPQTAATARLMMEKGAPLTANENGESVKDILERRSDWREAILKAPSSFTPQKKDSSR